MSKIICLNDILEQYESAIKSKNSLLADELKEKFINSKNNIIPMEDDYATSFFPFNPDIKLENLMVSYIKSCYKNNSEMRNKLRKYLFDYIKNLEEDIDNSYIINMIKDDEKLYNYIINTGNINEFEKKLIDIKIHKKNLKKENQPKLKGSTLIS